MARIQGKYVEMLGSVVFPSDLDHVMIIASGTGRWSGYLADLGHSIEGFKPAAQLVEIARRTHPGVLFRIASIDDLVDPPGPDGLSDVLVALRRVLEDGEYRPVFVLLWPPVRCSEPFDRDCLPLADGTHDLHA